MVTITRSYEISCGHHLPLHEGKCRTPHGHNYIIEVSVSGELQTEGPSTGMVMDFADVDKMTKVYLDGIDHKDLNELDFIPQPPTAENICQWLFSRLQMDMPVSSVKIYETSKSWVEVSNGD